MKNLAAALLMTIMVLATGVSSAQTDKQADKRFLDLKSLEGLSNSARAELVRKGLRELNINSAGNMIADIDPDRVEKWAKLISGTIKTISTDLSVSVNEFVKTDVGKATMFLIVYRVIGDDVKAIVFGIGAWLLVVPILLISFRHFHGSQKLTTKDEKGNVTDIKYIPRYEWNRDKSGGSESRSASAVVHAVMFAIMTWVVLAIIV